MKLHISIPNKCINEQYYIINVVLKCFLAIEYEINIYEKESIEIKMHGKEPILTINSGFFMIAEKSWLKMESLPSLPLEVWNPKDDGIIVNIDPPDTYKAFRMGNPDKIDTKPISEAMRNVVSKEWTIDRPEFGMDYCAKQYYSFFEEVLK